MIYFDKIEVVNVLKKEKAHATVKAYGVNYDRTCMNTVNLLLMSPRDLR